MYKEGVPPYSNIDSNEIEETYQEHRRRRSLQIIVTNLIWSYSGANLAVMTNPTIPKWIGLLSMIGGATSIAYGIHNSLNIKDLGEKIKELIAMENSSIPPDKEKLKNNLELTSDAEFTEDLPEKFLHNNL